MQDQGMVGDMLPQGHPVMNPFDPPVVVKMPRLSIQNFNGAKFMWGSVQDSSNGLTCLSRQLRSRNCPLVLLELNV